MVLSVIIPMSYPKWKLRFIFGVFLVWNTYPAGAQDACVIVAPEPVTFSETDPAGISLLNLTGGAAATWNIQIQNPGPPASLGLAPFFRLEQTGGNATYYLDKIFDLEEVAELLQNEFTIEFLIICSQEGAPNVEYQWFASVTAVNEFAPKFVRLPEGGFNISEAERVGDTILVLQDYVDDKDVEPNHPGFDFILLPYSDASVDGRQKLTLGDSLTGSVTVMEALDYEAMPLNATYYFLNVSVGDRNGMTSTGTVRINILDADDQPPEFWHPKCSSPCFTYYTAAIEETFQGAINWLEPAPIAARDQDSLGSLVTFRLKQGDPADFADYVTIDAQSGVPSIIKPVEDTKAAAFFVIVEAVEDTPLQHSQQTTLWLKVIGRNITDPTLPPVIVERSTGVDSSFRIATIVLGILFGIVLVILVIFVVCSMQGDVRTNPVLAKAIGKLSSDDSQSQGGKSSHSTRKKSRKSVTLAKTSGESRLDFMRSFSRTRPASPTLRSYASTSEVRDPDIENLPVSREIDYDQNGVEGEVESLPEQPAISTISDTDVVPYEDRLGLVHGAENMGEETVGMSNPVYETERDSDSVEVGVLPKDESPVYI